jgi:pyruvate,water dikinase
MLRGRYRSCLPGILDIEIVDVALDRMPPSPTKIMMNVGNPELAFEFRQPERGRGLARLEFIINKNVGIHPSAERIKQPAELQREITKRIGGYASPTEFYVAKITEGVATIAAAFWPKKVIVRLSDFKSNEYSNLVGGQSFEPHEENPMLGFRGASRYIAPEFHDCFALECDAMKRVRDDMGFTNVEVMIPFVRTLTEAEQVIALLKSQGLARGENGLRVIMMCEIPSNALLADRFLEHFDGFSIGSNDMTQLTLAVDRDAGGAIASSFDERDDAVKAMLAMAIAACRKAGKYAGICGQGPSGSSGARAMARRAGIESISLNPDTVVATWLLLAGKNLSSRLRRLTSAWLYARLNPDLGHSADCGRRQACNLSRWNKDRACDRPVRHGSAARRSRSGASSRRFCSFCCRCHQRVTRLAPSSFS